MSRGKTSTLHRAPRTPTLDCPNNVLARIFSFIDPFQLLGCGGCEVCRQWQQVLDENPQLWQHVSVELPGCRFHDHSRAKGVLLRKLKYILTRSGDLPLYLRIHNVDRRDQVLYMLQRNIHRIRSLKILLTGKGSHVVHFITHLVWPAPILKCFELTYDIFEMHIRTEVPVGIFAGHAPRLTHLALDLTFMLHRPIPAFAAVASLGWAPDPVHPAHTASVLPSLRHVMFGGSPESMHWIPEQGFGPGTLREVEFDLLKGVRDANVDNPMVPSLIGFSSAAYASGITRLTYRCMFASDQTFLATRVQSLLGPITALEMTVGGYMFQEVFDTSELGLGLKCTDAAGRSFEIANSAPHTRASWKSLPHGVLSGLAAFSFSEKALAVLQDSVARALPIPMPQLRELTVFVEPASRRNSSALFDCKGFRAPSMGPKIIAAPLLDTLRLVKSPSRPWWSGDMHGCQNIKSYCPVAGEPYDISAKSVSAFIRMRLDYSAARLGRVLLGPGVTFTEGFFSPAAEGVRQLADALQYL